MAYTPEEYKGWFIGNAIKEKNLGYTERRTTDNLYDPQPGNYDPYNCTKYWYELREYYSGGDWQGQDWCAGFVTWCLVTAVGVDNATKLLRHYPFVYCPTLGVLFKDELSNNPKKGDIVLFWRANNWNHTGIVVWVEDQLDGTYIWTVEGNTIQDSDYNTNRNKGYCVASKYHKVDKSMAFVSLDWNSIDLNPKNDGTWARNYLSLLLSYGYINSKDYWYWNNFTAPISITNAFSLICSTYQWPPWYPDPEWGISCLKELMFREFDVGTGNAIVNHTKGDNNMYPYRSDAGFEGRINNNLSRGECINLVCKAERYNLRNGQLNKYYNRYIRQNGSNVACINSLCDLKAISGNDGVNYWTNYEAPVARSHFMALLIKTHENDYGDKATDNITWFPFDNYASWIGSSWFWN